MLNVLLLILVVILVLAAVGTLPHWPWAVRAGWGYAPTGGLWLIALIILLLILFRW